LEIDWLFKSIILILLIFLSAFFSGSEVALFSLDKRKLNNNFGNNPLLLKYITNLLEYPRRLLVTILIGNTIVNVAASIVAVTIALEYSIIYNIPENIALTVQIILLTTLIILFGELTPKVLAVRNPYKFSFIVAIPIYWLSVLLYPASELITELMKTVAGKFNFDRKKTVITHDEIKHLAELGHEKGTLEESENELIQSIVSYKTVQVREIMKPRVDIIAVSTETTLDEIVKTITTSGHSRIPLYNNDLDEVVGIIYAKDLLPYIKDEQLKSGFKPKEIARASLFVPETKYINDLMTEFQEKKMHIAIIVDEYGGTSGLVTLEDIIEEIIGEIRDEYDKEEEPIVKINDCSYLVSGSLQVDEINETLDLRIDTTEADYDTIGGFVLEHAESIPKEGYSFELDGIRYTVKEVAKKRIKKIQIDIDEKRLSD